MGVRDIRDTLAEPANAAAPVLTGADRRRVESRHVVHLEGRDVRQLPVDGLASDGTDGVGVQQTTPGEGSGERASIGATAIHHRIV